MDRVQVHILQQQRGRGFCKRGPHQRCHRFAVAGRLFKGRVVTKSKKIQMYSDRFKGLVEYCDDVYACDVCGGMLCVMNIYIYTE
jgi:hypothetical protein